MPGCFGIIFSRDGAGLFVQITDGLDGCATAECVIEVHRAAAGHEEDMFNA
jgi:hypothetical protein